MDDKVINAVTYCPTKELVADYLRKPLQGSLFHIHHNSILGITDADEALFAESYKNKIGTRWFHYHCNRLKDYFIFTFITISPDHNECKSVLEIVYIVGGIDLLAF